MKTNTTILLTALISVLTTSCGGELSNKKGGETSAATTKVEIQSRPRKYAPPAIPAMLTTDAQKIDFLVSNYWDNFDFRDTVGLADSPYVEGAMATYIAILSKVQYDKASELLKLMMSKASVDSMALDTFAKIAEKYLYDANSPMRNDEYFIPVLQYMVQCDKLEDIMKIRPAEMLKMAKKNRVGMKAADFEYTLADGTSHQMHSIKSDYTLLFFNNPDCEDCKRVKQMIDNSKLLNELTQGKEHKLAILAIYPDEDIELWKKTDYPQDVINGYDPGAKLAAGRLYDLKAMPTLYLLDSNKKVVLKDAPIEIVLKWLQINGNY